MKLLENNGWLHSRTKGDHRIFTRQGRRPIVITGKMSDDLNSLARKELNKLINENNL
ncbi:MAG: type II toxin-antitoxin system HicA family toxin [Muribaculaceae bacterium]|nr:type II toxin-antitoxin system HicA family toxin [Muribaculaceae bacterium]